MSTNLDAINLSLEHIHHFLRYEEYSNGSITSLLSLEPVTELEQQELSRILTLFRSYYASRKISEGESNISVGAEYKWIELLVYPYPARKSPNLSNLTGSEPD